MAKKTKSDSCRSPTKRAPAVKVQRLGASSIEIEPKLRGRRTSGRPICVGSLSLTTRVYNLVYAARSETKLASFADPESSTPRAQLLSIFTHVEGFCEKSNSIRSL